MPAYFYAFGDSGGVCRRSTSGRTTTGFRFSVSLRAEAEVGSFDHDSPAAAQEHD